MIHIAQIRIVLSALIFVSISSVYLFAMSGSIPFKKQIADDAANTPRMTKYITL